MKGTEAEDCSDKGKEEAMEVERVVDDKCGDWEDEDDKGPLIRDKTP